MTWCLRLRPNWRPVSQTDRYLAQMILDADLPARLKADNERLREAARRVLDTDGDAREMALDHLADVIGYLCGKAV